MDRERVIVYIDENTDDGMMWEELNQEGQMRVSVYDEELEYDVEYSHSVVVKSLREYLAEHDKEVRKGVCQEVLSIIDEKFNCCGVIEEKFIDIVRYVLDKIQGEINGKEIKEN